MIILDVQQGSAEWLRARCGIPTASRFGCIVTPGGAAVKGKTRRTYLLELLAERLTGQTTPHFVTAAMQRGTDLEPKARAWYSLESGEAVSQVGFVLADGKRWGCSPDGITATGGVEVKCLGNAAHLDFVLAGAVPDDYWAQVQGSMWVCGRSHWDFCAYTDVAGMPSRWIRVPRDDAMMQAFAQLLPAFCDDLDEAERAVKTGV